MVILKEKDMIKEGKVILHKSKGIQSSISFAFLSVSKSRFTNIPTHDSRSPRFTTHNSRFTIHELPDSRLTTHEVPDSRLTTHDSRKRKEP